MNVETNWTNSIRNGEKILIELSPEDALTKLAEGGVFRAYLSNYKKESKDDIVSTSISGVDLNHNLETGAFINVDGRRYLYCWIEANVYRDDDKFINLTIQNKVMLWERTVLNIPIHKINEILNDIEACGRYSFNDPECVVSVEYIDISDNMSPSQNNGYSTLEVFATSLETNRRVLILSNGKGSED